VSAADKCGCDQARAAEREIARLRVWLHIILDDGACEQDAAGECLGPGYCMQATAAAALDGEWPLGEEPGDA
jgi:hypothetical protein